MNALEGLGVADRAELLESALDALTEAIAVAGTDGRVVLWNSSAELITGWTACEVAGQRVREMLNALLPGGVRQWVQYSELRETGICGNVVNIRHKAGYEIPVVARVLLLRDGMGGEIGTGVLFHPAESIDALPQADLNDIRVSESQEGFQNRLVCLHEEFRRGDLPMGVLWVSVDQVSELLRSHGTGACEAMLQTLGKTIAS